MREKGISGRFVCPCCGYATLGEVNGYEICTICFWEDDGQDDSNADEEMGGPNKISLTHGRKNFLLVGVSDPKDQEHVRKPNQKDEKIREYKIVNNKIIRLK